MNADFIDSVRKLVTRPHFAHAASRPPRIIEQPPAAPQVTGQRELDDQTWQVWWQSVRGALGYEIQVNPHPVDQSGWREWGQVVGPIARLRLSMPSGRTWLRIRAYTTGAVGLWSDPIPLTKVAHEVRQAA